MKLVLDNNILFSLMKPNSINSYLFFSLNVEFIAPEFIKSEFNKHKERCLFKSGLSEHEFEIRQAEVESNIKFFKSSEYEYFLKKSLEVMPDPDDIDFLALSLSTNSSIWSNDNHFKELSVFKTKELLNKLLKGEL